MPHDGWIPLKLIANLFKAYLKAIKYIYLNDTFVNTPICVINLYTYVMRRVAKTYLV